VVLAAVGMVEHLEIQLLELLILVVAVAELKLEIAQTKKEKMAVLVLSFFQCQPQTILEQPQAHPQSLHPVQTQF
jgi:hypothetical protein